MFFPSGFCVSFSSSSHQESKTEAQGPRGGRTESKKRRLDVLDLRREREEKEQQARENALREMKERDEKAKAKKKERKQTKKDNACLYTFVFFLFSSCRCIA